MTQTPALMPLTALPVTQTSVLDNAQQIATVSEILKVISNPDRLKILCVLITAPLNVQQIEQQTGIVQPTLSQQLAVLRKHDMVSTHREGKQIYYHFKDPKILRIMQLLDGLYCHPN